MQVHINGEQSEPLRNLMRGQSMPGEPITLTQQGDGSLVVAFTGATFEITTAGTVFEEN